FKQTDSDGLTPLGWAAENGRVEIVNGILSAGVWVDQCGRTSETPLLRAAKNGHRVIVEILIASGADIMAKNDRQRIPLSLAANGGHLQTVKHLLHKMDKKYDVDSKDANGCTALILAAIKGFKDIVGVLIEYGAHTEERDKCRRTALLWDAELGHGEVVEMLLNNPVKNAKVDATDDYNHTPLSLAAQSGNNEVVQTLVKYEADIEAMNDEKQTPLFLAVVNEFPQVVRILIRSGANIEAMNRSLQTPLSSAAMYGYTKIGEILLKEKAEIGVKDTYGMTPIAWSTETGRTEFTEMLIRHGAKRVPQERLRRGWL
ncbi:ankyrin repeat-containing domain protein, partial [Xylogone sp. PMI_703]